MGIQWSINVLLFLLVCAQFSCNSTPIESQTSKVTSANIDLEQFKILLKDLYVLEGMYYRNELKSFHPDTFNALQLEVFDKHNITKKEFRQAYQYFHQKPELIDEVYQEMINEFEIEREKKKDTVDYSTIKQD